ncbi:MAG: adaptor protein MecA [Ruminococcus sp.]
MVFVKIDEHTIRCIMKLEELSEMGYDPESLLKEQDPEKIQHFLHEIMDKAKAAGVELTEDYRAVQSIVLPGHYFALNFSNIQPADQINGLVTNFLEVADAVEEIGRGKLEEILEKEGEEKISAFNAFMSRLKELHASIKGGQTESHQQKETFENYILKFSDLDTVEKFCKAAAFNIPGRLYKDKKDYCMLLEGNAENLEDLNRLLLLACEYADAVEPDHFYSQCLEEHGDIIIRENPIDVLKNL